MPSILQQFRSFYLRNYPNSLEETVAYFSVFGGLGEEIDTDTPLMELIESTILEHYGTLYNEISRLTLADQLYHKILSGIAQGDRRTHSAFKRAHISPSVGESAIDYLIQTGIIEREVSREKPPQKAYPAQKLKKEVEKHQISDKLRFTSPFLRFWFAFVNPLHRSIEQGDFSEFKKRFEKHQQGFSGFIFERLSIEFLKHHYADDPIVEIGSYWDRQVEIDILARTASGKVIAAECKYTNTKVNRSEMSKLKEKVMLSEIEVSHFVLFAKRGFSNELLGATPPDFQLYALDDFKVLLENLQEAEKVKPFIDTPL